MAKVWILETQTKGTGANMVPLDRARQRTPAASERPFVPPKRRPRLAPEPARRPPRRFKVVDVVSGRALAEDVGTRDALRALRDVVSVVDVTVHAWDDRRGRWRLLTRGEQQALWAARDRVA
jgi:hypothetical protein